jgi:hypothetical protein
METRVYGTLQSEKLAEENNLCRRIVRDLNDMAINDRQKLFIVHLLAMELENLEHSRELSMLVRDLGGEDFFVSQKKD